MIRVIRFANKFVLEREIGSGGMSRVFLGRDEVLDRPVAIKVLRPDLGETDIGARFRREGRTAAKLSHAHDRGIVHRYIKPHNVLMDEHGSPKLTDFGIARALDVDHSTSTGSYL